MSLPENPVTRVDQYLNNIATGGGEIPEQPQTRIEQYLDYIAAHGGGGGGGGSAASVSYDNTDSGLEAENVQEAIDELAEKASELDGKLDKDQGVDHAGNFLIVGDDGKVATRAFETPTVAAALASERYAGVDLTVKFADEIANYADEWAWIKARITAGNYEGLNVHDFIPVTCTNGYILKPEIAGFDTYTGAGSPEVGRHIDFITKDCWPDAFQYNPANNNNGFRFVFTGDGSTKDFVCDKNASNFNGATFTGYPYEINRVLNGTTEVTSGWTYDNTTGTLHFNTAPESGASIQAQSAIAFFASNAYAFLNSLKTVVPNSTTFDGDLKDVDYTNGGVYSKLPQKLKNVIAGKNMAWPTRCKASALQSNADNYKFATSLPLWLPDEMEVYGTPMLGTGTYEKWFGRQYPCFQDGNRKKGSGNGGSRAYWWLAVASASPTYVCYVYYTGAANHNGASSSTRGPVCFRITA